MTFSPTRLRRLSTLLWIGLAMLPVLALLPADTAGATTPSLAITPAQVSCTTPMTITGQGFQPGTQVVLAAGAPEDVPTSIYLASLGPYTVAADGSFTAGIPAGFGIYGCFGGPLGRDGAPYRYSARTILAGPDANGEWTLGAPSATASFSFVADPDDPRLTLSPDHGSGCLTIVARGINFRPGSFVTLYAGALGGHVFGQVNDEPVAVDLDGEFTWTLPRDRAPFIDCDGPTVAGDGTRYIVGASTGRPKIDEDPDGPRAAAVFTVTLSPEERFERTWQRADGAVASGEIARTWVWGPAARTAIAEEPYADSPTGSRLVVYYDKSRMEITDPDGDRTSPWYVTNGLLVVEMVEGWYQTGDEELDTSPEPAGIPIAGDRDSTSITYAGIAAFGLREAGATPAGTTITTTIDADGTIGKDASHAADAVTAAVPVAETGHTVASVFWQFMTSTSAIMLPDGSTFSGPLFENPFYATGYPITEAYWSDVTVDGVEQPLLWQCFERRCLTYTPENPAGWQVEAGNVGLHYLSWRYPDR